VRQTDNTHFLFKEVGSQRATDQTDTQPLVTEQSSARRPATLQHLAAQQPVAEPPQPSAGQLVAEPPETK